MLSGRENESSAVAWDMTVIANIESAINFLVEIVDNFLIGS